MARFRLVPKFQDLLQASLRPQIPKFLIILVRAQESHYFPTRSKSMLYLLIPRTVPQFALMQIVAVLCFKSLLLAISVPFQQCLLRLD